MNRTRIKGLILGAGACLALFTSIVRAATVDVSIIPTGTEITLGDIFQVTVSGSYTGPAPLAGGGFNLHFDPATLRVNEVYVNPAVGDFVAEPGVIDNSAGRVDVVGFASFFGVAGSFSIATATLEAIGVGVSDLVLTDSGDPVFVWTNYDYSVSPAGDTVDPTFFGGSVTVVPTPIPAAAPLLVSALIGLSVVGRRRCAGRSPASGSKRNA